LDTFHIQGPSFNATKTHEHGTARVRTQVSAAHSREDLEFAANAFAEVNEELK
jgi:7-keto-8-aminopelargonate synthetase-like enzyme